MALTTFRDAYGQEWHAVESLSQTVDLSSISRALHQQRIPHRIAEEGNSQVIWVARAEDQQRVKEFIEAWRRGDIEIVESAAEPPAQSGYANQARFIVQLLPATCALLLLSLLGYLVVITDDQLQIGHWFTIVDFSRYQVAELSNIDFSEAWRLWTPMFLHFDLMHIAFNALFIWLFGARMERVMGTWHFVAFVAAVGLAANLGQLMWESNPRFGGMSGVNYGFVGYIWLRQMFAPHPMLVFPKALIPFLLIMLLLGTFGVLDFFVQGRIANAAHMTGLLAGVSWGLLAGLYHSRRGKPPSEDPSRDETDCN